MHERLHTALGALRFDSNEKPGARINLLFAIQAHAQLLGDHDIVVACREEIERIRGEVQAARVAAAKEVEDLALFVALRFRAGFEELHVEHKRTKLTNEAIAYMNRRAARRAFEILSRRGCASFPGNGEVDWAGELFNAAYTETDLREKVVVAENELAAALAGVREDLRRGAEIVLDARASGLGIRRFVNEVLGLYSEVLPIGWDSPTLPVPPNSGIIA